MRSCPSVRKQTCKSIDSCWEGLLGLEIQAHAKKSCFCHYCGLFCEVQEREKREREGSFVLDLAFLALWCLATSYLKLLVVQAHIAAAREKERKGLSVLGWSAGVVLIATLHRETRRPRGPNCSTSYRSRAVRAQGSLPRGGFP